MRKLYRKIIENPQWFLVLCIVQAFMTTAAYISAGDIMTLASRWGVYPHLLWTAPLFIDGLTWMGKFGRSMRFEPPTRKAGLVLMALGGAMSLAANIAAGENPGMRVYGALVVVGFVTAEWYSTKLRPAKREEETAPADSTTRVLTHEDRAKLSLAASFSAYQRMTPTRREKYRALHGAAPAKPGTPAYLTALAAKTAELRAAAAAAGVA